MSGIELVGLAASVLQIADLGWKVSYKLYAFSKKVHEAGKTIELISQDISATGAILKQLGDAVKEDEKANPASRLCSQGLIDAAGKLVEECQELFKEIDIGIGGRDGHKVILGFKQKLKWSYLEPRVELLRKNLERLKSSLAIMLNVLIYAEQLRGRENKTILSEQQTLVASFATQKAETEKRIEHLKRAIEYQPASEAPSDPENANLEASTFLSADENEKLPPHVNATRDLPVTAGNQPPPYLFQMNAVTTAIATVSARTPQHQSGDIPQSAHVAPAEASKPSSVLPHLEHHRKLIEKLLEEVNSSRYAIDHGVRYRLHDGVLDLHWQEWSPLRQTHGDDVLRRLLAQSPVLARHWHKQVSSSESDASVRGKSFSAAAKESLSTSGRRDTFPSIEDLEPKAHAAPDPADGELLERQAVAVGNFTNTKDSEPKLGTERAEKADLVGTQLIAYEPSTHQDLSIEATDEEDIDSLYEEIKTIKQNDVLSTRNTLRGATQAEESGQDTLARLGVQSENLPTRYRNLDLSTTDSMVGTDRHKFSRSMFAVHSVNPLKAPQDSYVEGPSSSQTAQPSTSLSYDNPVTSPKDIVGGALGAASAAGTSRAQMGDRERRRSRRGSSRSRQSSKSSVSSRERGRAAEGDALDHQILPEAGPVGKAQRLGARKVFLNNFSAAGGNTALILEDRPGPSELTHVHPGAPHPSTKKMLAERSKYQFEADTDDDEVGDEIDLAKGAGSTAIDWGKLLARATGDEVGAEHHRTINRVGSKACSPSNAFFLY